MLAVSEDGQVRFVKKPRRNITSFEVNGPALGSKVDLQEEILTSAEAAKLTKMSVVWFTKMRWKGQGPPYRKRGRSVRYLKTELLAWWINVRDSDFLGD